MPTKNRLRMDQFVGAISNGQHLPQIRFLGHALRGMFLSGDVMLSSWGRALREPQALMYTTKRLSRGLVSKRLDDRALADAALRVTSKLVKRHCSVISVDATDISKKYAKKMPFIAAVHDGSAGEVADGWIVLRADGVAKNGRHVPLHIATFSRDHPSYVSDGNETRKFLESILAHVPLTTPFVFDAGHDGRSHRKLFVDLKIRFTLRLVTSHGHGKRRVIVGDETSRLADMVDSTASTSQFRISKFTDKAKGAWVAKVGWRRDVQFVDRRGSTEKSKYSVVVVRGYRKNSRRMVLMTTDRILTDAQAREVVDRYFARWAVEDGHRLLKDRFKLENLRVLTWRGLKRVVFLTHAAYAFMAWNTYHGDGEELARRAPAFGPVPKFPYYRLAMALATIL